MSEPNEDGHVEINTDAPRAGPVGDAVIKTEADVIAEAAGGEATEEPLDLADEAAGDDGSDEAA